MHINYDIKDMIISEEEIENYKKTTHCYLCKKPFANEKDQKVRDHNHLTRKYHGPAHNSCNLELGRCDFIPVFIHKLSNYDPHLFIKQFSKLEGKIHVIPQTDEKYISISQFMKVRKINNNDTGEFKHYLYK